jgi:hypothetical protein
MDSSNVKAIYEYHLGMLREAILTDEQIVESAKELVAALEDMENKSISYVLTSGDYSDYSIVAVFDSKEKAEQYKAAHEHGEAIKIEEYETNPEPPTVFPHTIVRGTSEDSNIIEIRYRYLNVYRPQIFVGGIVYPVKQRIEVQIPRECTEMEAAKIYSEKRAQLIAVHPEGLKNTYYDYDTLVRRM